MGSFVLNILGSLVVALLVLVPTVLFTIWAVPSTRTEYLRQGSGVVRLFRAFWWFLRPRPFILARRELMMNLLDDLSAYPLDFEFTVSRWPSMDSRLQGDEPTEQGMDVSCLTPGPATKVSVVVGDSGRGKSSVSIRLLRHLIADPQCVPVYLDLKEAANRLGMSNYEFREKTSPEILSDVMKAGGLPEGTDPVVLDVLCSKCVVVLIIDGFNEVPQEARNAVIEQTERLAGIKPARGLRRAVFTRPLQNLSTLFASRLAVYSVDELDEGQVERMYDQKHAAGDYLRLDERTQTLLAQPFFLDLARRGAAVSAAQGVSEMLERFLVEIARLQPKNFFDVGRQYMFPPAATASAWVSGLDQEVARALRTAGILLPSGDFSHDNWRNFFAGRYLVEKGAEWTYRDFDRATNFGAENDALLFAVEAMATADRRGKFLRAVYDWNYAAAAECAATSCFERTSPIKAAVLASSALKRFDQFGSTARRAEGLLTGLHDEMVREMREAKDSSEVLGIARQAATGEWFDNWFRFASHSHADLTPTQWSDAIGSPDSVLGWAAANDARMAALTTHDLKALRELYGTSTGDGQQTVRWRIVHVLGAYPGNEENLKLLERALKDGDHWVRYGALRSVMELGVQCQGEKRERIVRLLGSLAEALRGSAMEADKAVMRQLRCGLDISAADDDWISQMRAILKAA